MALAAETTRNILLQTPIGDNGDDDLEAKCMSLRAIARDMRLATRLEANTSAGAAHLLINGDSIELRDPSSFETEVRASNEARNEWAMQREALAANARSSGSGRAKEVLFRRALLWNPQGRRRVLQGIQHAQEGHGDALPWCPVTGSWRRGPAMVQYFSAATSAQVSAGPLLDEPFALRMG